MKEKQLVPLRPKDNGEPRPEMTQKPEVLSSYQLQKEIQKLRQKKADEGLKANEAALLKSYIHDLTQTMILEDSGYAEVTDELREEVRKQILELTDPKNALNPDELDFEKALSPEIRRRIVAVAEQILGYKESRRAEMKAALAKSLKQDFRKDLPGITELLIWIDAAIKRIREQREESADEIAKYVPKGR